MKRHFLSIFQSTTSAHRGVVRASQVLVWVLLLSFACVEPYQPPEITENVDILVIDGFLNSAERSSMVRLTHAIALSDEGEVTPELNALVSIQDELGNTYDLIEQDTGTYALTGIDVDPATRYMLSVRTAGGDQFVSDFVNVVPTPAIDSVTWSADKNGVYVLINTHDDTGNTNYYRWDYVETWKYHAPVSSDFIFIPGATPIYRPNDERIYYCWRTLPSTKISIKTTIKLAEDVVHAFPVTFLPKESSKISVKYSTLIKQRAISKSEFDYLQQLQKTTESLGGLFDPQPSQVLGNIRNVNDPLAPVLGFFSAGATVEERLFIDYFDLPKDLQKLPYPVGCEQDTVYNAGLKNLSGTVYLGSAIYSGPSIIGYTKSTARCADCRTQGGTTTEPPFWE